MGGYRSPADYARALRPAGIFVWAGGKLKGLFQTLLFGPWIGRKGKKKLTALSHHPNTDDLRYVADLIATGKVKPVIDRCFALAEIAEAFRFYQAGHMRGKVVVSVIGDEQSQSAANTEE